MIESRQFDKETENRNMTASKYIRYINGMAFKLYLPRRSHKYAKNPAITS